MAGKGLGKSPPHARRRLGSRVRAGTFGFPSEQVVGALMTGVSPCVRVAYLPAVALGELDFIGVEMVFSRTRSSCGL